MTSRDSATGNTQKAIRGELFGKWTESLAQVLESMTDQSPAVEWHPVCGSFSEIGPVQEADVLWWEQPFQIDTRPTVWVAAPRATWEEAGTRTLKAAGLDTVDPAEARSTWLEILSQSLSSLARSVGSILGREVCCEGGSEKAAGPEVDCWAAVTLKFGDAEVPALYAGFGPGMLSLLSVAEDEAASDGGENRGSEQRRAPGGRDGANLPRTMDFLFDVELPVSISFGKVQIPMKDVLKLTTGSIVELNRGVNEQVEVLVNHCLIARGEVVVVDGNYGVKIQQIVSAQERLRSVR